MCINLRVWCWFQLILNEAGGGTSIQCGSPSGLLPAVASVVGMADSHDRAAFTLVSKIKEKPMDVESLDNKEEVSRCNSDCYNYGLDKIFYFWKGTFILC